MHLVSSRNRTHANRQVYRIIIYCSCQVHIQKHCSLSTVFDEGGPKSGIEKVTESERNKVHILVSSFLVYALYGY